MNGRSKRFTTGLRPGHPPDAATISGPARRLVALVLILALTAVTWPATPAFALSLPWPRHTETSLPAGQSRGMAPLQEVSPPDAVQQLQSALGARQPVVEILSPRDESVLPAGPWSLKLRVHDWPLVDGGRLGVGPHLVVQLDQEPPRVWTRSEGQMPELSPGSHRLTVYAALPWGEARKNPGAVQQIRLHRTAPNPLTLPTPGSPQLLAVSPSGPADQEPLLLDWLLLNAPLQDVGGSGTQWRLRLTINGEDALLEQQSPLWLRGWRPGPNALRLELLDGRGEPLNPPFNSLVQEVDLKPAMAPLRWRGERLSAGELAILLGEAPAVPPPARALPSAASPPSGPTSSHLSPGRGADGVSATETVEAPVPQAPPDADGGPEIASVVTIHPPQPDRGTLPPRQSTAQGPLNPAAAPESDAPSSASPGQDGQAVDRDERNPGNPAAAEPASEDAELVAAPLASAALPAGALLAGKVASPPAAPELPAAHLPTPQPRAAATDLSLHPPQQTMPPAPLPAPPTSAPWAATTPQDGDDPERIRPSTALTGRARDLVNDDGTLRRPERRGPLANLREWLQR